MRTYQTSSWMMTADKKSMGGGFDRALRLVSRNSLYPMMLAIVFLVVAGCTSPKDYVKNGFKVGPNYHKPAAQVADHWIDSNDPNVSSQQSDLSSWWGAFSDPTLDALIQNAYQQNLTLRSAGFRILQARAVLGYTTGTLFPQGQELNGSYSRINTSGNSAQTQFNALRYEDWQAGAGLAWELDFWGRFRRAVESANADLDASIENYDNVLVLLLSEVARQYMNIRTAEQRLEYARKNVEIQTESLNIADIKFQNGATTKLDVTQGQSSLAQTQALIPPLEVARRQAANQLCILLGIPPQDLDAMLGQLKSIPSAAPQVVVGIPAELLRRRPDVRAAERQVASQSAKIGVAVSELYPHFSITGSIYVDSSRFNNLFSPGSIGGSVGPSFNWNVLNYGRLANNIRLQDARFQQLVVDYQNTVLNANAEAENALVGFLKSQQQVKYLAESTVAADQSVGLVRDQYSSGKADFNRVLTVEQQLTQQQDQLAAAQGAVANNLVQLYKALGGGWQIRLGGGGVSRLPAAEVNQTQPQPAPVPTAPIPTSSTQP